MIVNIYDVAHGFCGYVRDQVNGANLLFDCGYNELTGVHPVDEVLTYGPIGGLVVQNYDEDHVDGLPYLLSLTGATPAAAMFRNPSLNVQQLFSLKTPPYGKGIVALSGLMQRYVWPLPANTGTPGEVWISQYWNPYPLFRDTNNLSLVTFVHGPGYTVLFAGDMERAGWKMLLLNPAFRNELALVRIFVASHHGRDNGYCEEVFRYCWPDVVIISDESMQYDTQENCYAEHASGIMWSGSQDVRRVLTTRRDGDIRIGPWPGFLYLVRTAA